MNTTKLEVSQGGKCRVCGRVLRSPASREAGIGPVCASKTALPASAGHLNDVRAEFLVVRVTPEMVWITDESNKRGGKSVTNDADGVVGWLLAHHPGRRIVYRDTDGNWDELKHDGQRFTGFAPARDFAPGEWGT